MPKKKLPPTNDLGRRPQDWTTEQKLSVVLDAQGLGEEQLGGRSEKQPGLEARRIRELERELARKDKALAEAAALLVLQKKFRALMGAEDDDTEPRSGR